MHLGQRGDTQAARRHDLLERPARRVDVRDAGIVHEHVESAELGADALGRPGDGALIGDVELHSVGVVPDSTGGCLTLLQVA